MKDERMEDVEWEWLMNGDREVDKVMYDLEWENRNRREQDYTPKPPSDLR